MLGAVLEPYSRHIQSAVICRDQTSQLVSITEPAVPSFWPIGNEYRDLTSRLVCGCGVIAYRKSTSGLSLLDPAAGWFCSGAHYWVAVLYPRSWFRLGGSLCCDIHAAGLASTDILQHLRCTATAAAFRRVVCRS